MELEKKLDPAAVDVDDAGIGVSDVIIRIRSSSPWVIGFFLFKYSLNATVSSGPRNYINQLNDVDYSALYVSS